MRTHKSLYLVSLWMIYWLAVGGATIYVWPALLNADQLHNSWIICIHFAVFAIISARFFRVHESLPHLKNTKAQLASIVVMLLLFLLTTSAYSSFFALSETAENLIITSKLYYPLFSIETTLPKVFDVVFQQITLFGFIKYLLSKGFEKKQVTMIMWLTFASLHTPLLLGANVHAMTLVLPSLFAGLLFSYLTLYFRHGLALSFAMHLCFYFTTGVVLRTFYSQ